MRFEKDRVVKILFWLALAGSYVLYVIHKQSVPGITPFNDKGNHFIDFSVLTILLLDG